VTTKPLRIAAIPDPRFPQNADALYNKHQISLQYLLGAYPIDGTQVRMRRLNLNKDSLDIDSFKTTTGCFID